MELKKGKYRHFKGKEYELLEIATHSETLEQMVVYRALYGDRGIWSALPACGRKPWKKTATSAPASNTLEMHNKKAAESQALPPFYWCAR